MNTHPFYFILNTVNKLLISTIFALTYSSITIAGEQPFHSIINFALSYGIAEMLYQIAKRTYKPLFVDKDAMNFADWIDTHIGPKQNHEIVDPGTYRERYRFELNLVVLVFSIILYLTFHMGIGILTKYLHIALPLRTQAVSFTKGLTLFFQYIMVMLCLMSLVAHVQYDIKHNKKLFRDGYEIVMCLLFFLFLFIFLKELCTGIS